ncbi:hypothetical protein [Mucilaginibacter arboris]|uniref:Uncharacterized protein n=1 Tax=Mucilaginibacter arboris TaxID=2682090 RepID=A0A7K1T1U0_9SPHI|nr:hypothetical protein [Mucilaginibacter arboris]MVN23552.1 hypothetical protein [Mucilaginibacter arboris]
MVSADGILFPVLRQAFSVVRNIMTPKFLLTSLLVLMTTICFSQTNFDVRRKKIKPLFIDTAVEKTFIYDLPNAVLYFKQSDISDFITNVKNIEATPNYSFKNFTDTLKSNTKTIRVKDIFYSYGEVERDSILRHERISADMQELNEEFHLIGNDLIFSGHVMVYSKGNKKFIFKPYIAKKQTSSLGQQDLIFYLPNGKIFYQILIAFGE